MVNRLKKERERARVEGERKSSLNTKFFNKPSICGMIYSGSMAAPSHLFFHRRLLGLAVLKAFEPDRINLDSSAMH